MSSDALPIDLDSLPLVARTDMRDVRVVSVVARTDDVVPTDTEIAVRMTRSQYRVEEGSLFVRTSAEAQYLAHPPEEAEGATAEEGAAHSTDAAPAEQREVGSIEVEVLAELDFQGGEVTPAQIDEFLDHNFLFMIFPYVRTVLQQTAADLRLPPTVLPFLRRGSLTSAPRPDSRDTEGPTD